MGMSKHTLVVSLTLLAVIHSGCASKRLTKGSYQINKTQTGFNKPGVVYGAVYEYGTKLPATVPRVYIARELQAKADPRSGEYTFTIKPGRYRFTGRAMSYYPVKTSKIKVHIGDSLRIDFYLRLDETPLID